VPSFLYQRGEFDAATAVQQGGNVFVANTESEVDTFDAGITFRHGLPFYAQFEASLPYRFVLREDTTDVGGALVSSSSRDGSGIGDLRLGLAKTLLREEEWWPSLIGRFTWDTATGDQRDDGLALGFGFHELEASLTALYTADPMVFFGTIGYEHAFEKDDLDPGDSISLILGTAVAVSPETSLTFSLDQTYREDFELNGRKVDGSDRLSSNFNFGTSTILGPRTLLTISASIGLTEDAPNYSLGIALPIRFNSPIQ